MGTSDAIKEHFITMTCQNSLKDFTRGLSAKKNEGLAQSQQTNLMKEGKAQYNLVHG